MKIHRLLSLGALCAAGAAWGEYAPEEWRFRRAIAVERPGEVHRAVLDGAAVGRAQPDMADLRIDFRGAETPYAARRMAGAVRESELAPEVTNKGYLPGAGTHVTLDTGGGGKHSRLRIVSSESNYRRRVVIETSADGRRWSVARRDGYVLDFEHDGRRIAAREVDYPVSSHRYVRATLHDWTKPETLTGVTLLLRETVPAELVTVATLTGQAKPLPEQRAVEYGMDLGELLTFDRVRIESADREFHRAARAMVSDDGKTWRYLAEGFLSRVTGSESLTLTGGTQRVRYIKVIVFHEDNQPIAVTRFHLEAAAWEVRFLPNDAGRYLLCYGNSDARAPVYDLPRVLERRDPSPEVTVALGPVEQNTDYRPREKPTPWTERHPAILYATLIAAVLALGYVTVRFFRNVRGGAG